MAERSVNIEIWGATGGGCAMERKCGIRAQRDSRFGGTPAVTELTWLTPLLILLVQLLQGCVSIPQEQPISDSSGPVAVRIVKTDAGYQLTRNGKPYFIKGAGGWERLDELKAAGANSFRTWGAADDGKYLDAAKKLDLTVTFGIWLGHKAHGFDYDDPRQVREQWEQAREIVLRYKDHPALLIWGVGNEMEGVEGVDEAGWANPSVWKAVEDVAAMIKSVDPNHPTITVIAEFNQAKIDAIKRYCPSVDALGINSYGAMATVPSRLRKCGWNKPYIITEAGPTGPWQTVNAPWGAPIEESSTLKAYSYLIRYQAAVETQRQWCLGSYVYFWGVEPNIVQTHTWYETFLPGSGEKLGAVDAFTLLWTGRFPENRAPEIVYWSTDAALLEVAPDSVHTGLVFARDADGDNLRFSWEVRAESRNPTGPIPPVVNVPIDVDDMWMTFRAPKEEGPYRLFLYVFDGNGAAATANMPFYVRNSDTAK